MRPQSHAMQCRQQEALASQAKSQLRSGHKHGHKHKAAHQLHSKGHSKGHGPGESATGCPLIADCDQAPFASVQHGMQKGLPAGLFQPSATQQWNSEAHCQMGCVSDQEADSQQDAFLGASASQDCNSIECQSILRRARLAWSTDGSLTAAWQC